MRNLKSTTDNKCTPYTRNVVLERNLYFYPELVETFIDLLNSFPMWTDIIETENIYLSSMKPFEDYKLQLNNYMIRNTNLNFIKFAEFFVKHINFLKNEDIKNHEYFSNNGLFTLKNK